MFENIAIIGNGPSEIGTGNGSKIDSFDKVVRMNNFYISDEFSNDYGVKVNCWCTNMNSPVGTKYREDPFEKVFVPFPFNKLNRSAGSKQIYNRYKDIVECMPDSYYKELMDLIKSTTGKSVEPSTGLGMLFWIWKETGQLSVDQVFGFSFFRDLHTERKNWHHYFDDNIEWVPGYVVSHNGDIEKQVFEYMVTNNEYE